MTKDEQYSYIFFAAFMLLFLFWIVPDQIIRDDSASVSPRLLPQLLGGGILLISVIQIVRSFTNSELVRPEFAIERRSYLALVIVLLVLLVTSTIAIRAPSLVVNGIAVGRFWFGATLMIPILLVVGGVRIWWHVILYTISLILLAFFFTYITGIFIA